MTIVKAGLDDIDVMTEAFKGVDGVISGLSMGVKAKRGAFSPKSKNPNIFKAMKAAGVRKFVVISGASSPVPGEWIRPSVWLHYLFAHLILPANLIRENIAESKALFRGIDGSDGIDWVIARTARIDKERAYSGAEISERSVVSFMVSPEDVGDFCLFAVSSSEFNGKAPYIGSRKT